MHKPIYYYPVSLTSTHPFIHLSSIHYLVTASCYCCSHCLIASFDSLSCTISHKGICFVSWQQFVLSWNVVHMTYYPVWVKTDMWYHQWWKWLRFRFLLSSWHLVHKTHKTEWKQLIKCEVKWESLCCMKSAAWPPDGGIEAKSCVHLRPNWERVPVFLWTFQLNE